MPAPPPPSQAEAIIAEALRRAALAGMNPAERFHADQHHRGEAGPGHMAEAAATVAAFLLALPPDALLAGYGWAREPLKAMAATVERVAARPAP